jgi:hypothetical protein
MTEQPLLLSVEPVAQLLDCSQSHVWRQSDAGKMPNPRHPAYGCANR